MFNGHCIVEDIWQVEVAADTPTKGMRVAAHTPLALRALLKDIWLWTSLLIEEFLDMVRAQPTFQQVEVWRICFCIGNRNLVRTVRTFKRFTIHFFDRRPALR